MSIETHKHLGVCLQIDALISPIITPDRPAVYDSYHRSSTGRASPRRRPDTQMRLRRHSVFAFGAEIGKLAEFSWRRIPKRFSMTMWNCVEPEVHIGYTTLSVTQQYLRLADQHFRSAHNRYSLIDRLEITSGGSRIRMASGR
jgi:hypothetical protein